MDKYYSNYELAEQETTQLYKLPTTKYVKKEYIDLKIDVMLQQAFLKSIIGDHHKALQLSLKALEESEKNKLPERIYKSLWTIAIMYENGQDYTNCKKYLDKAYKTYKTYNLENIFSVYNIRIASYYRFINKIDSTIYHAQKALELATKYKNKREIRDACLLLGGYLPFDKYKEAVNYKSLAAHQFLEIEDYSSASSQFSNAARILLLHNETNLAKKYSDSAFYFLKRSTSFIDPHNYKTRSEIFEKQGQLDSVLYYLKIYYNSQIDEHAKMEMAEIKKVSEKYQNEQNKSIIQNKNKQMLLIGILLGVIIIGSIVLYRKNRKIDPETKSLSSN